MPRHVVLLSLPGLREKDLASMPALTEKTRGGRLAVLSPSFPCVTCSVQANMTTGKPPRAHGIVCNGIYWRQRHHAEMWTAPNEAVEQSQLWDLLGHHEQGLTSAIWFPMHSKGCEADYVCTPAPIHNPDGSESLWCYTRPGALYGTLRDTFGHFPLKHYWGPFTQIAASKWIADSAVYAMREFQPDFFYIYLPHLDYEGQRHGPDSPQATTAAEQLDGLLAGFFEQMEAVSTEEVAWIIAGEYAMTPTDHVVYPNRVLREAGLLATIESDEGRLIDFARTPAWAMADHQCSHVFVRDADPDTIARVVDVFSKEPGIAEVLHGEALAKYDLDHPRSGEVVLVCEPDSWQAYYYWMDDADAPAFARTVDIHKKPGYDPVELFFDMETKSIPLEAGLIRGSHGAPAVSAEQKTVLLTSSPDVEVGEHLRDVDVFGVALSAFGMSLPR